MVTPFYNYFSNIRIDFHQSNGIINSRPAEFFKNTVLRLFDGLTLVTVSNLVLNSLVLIERALSPTLGRAFFL